MEIENGWNDIGASESESIMAVVPVKVKNKKSNKVIETYASRQYRFLLYRNTPSAAPNDWKDN